MYFFFNKTKALSDACEASFVSFRCLPSFLCRGRCISDVCVDIAKQAADVIEFRYRVVDPGEPSLDIFHPFVINDL